MDEFTRNSISQIARNAIQEIDRIAQLVSNPVPVSNSSDNHPSPRPSLSVNDVLRPDSGSRRGRGHGHRNPSTPGEGNALSELRRRFPTYANTSGRSGGSRSVRGGRTSRSHAAGSGVAVGRPSKDFAIKDIIIVGAGVNKTPLGREEKLQLEKKNRVVSGFSIDKTWNEKVLYEKVKAQFPDDCKSIDFEFVKNCYGTLIVPTLASGVKIDANILLKSISSAGTIYVRLFVDDDDDINDDDFQLPNFDYLFHDQNNQGESLTTSHNQRLDGSRVPQCPPTSANLPVNEPIDLTAEEELKEINDITQQVVKDCENYQNPAEILRHLQSKVLTGRQLDIVDPSQEITGETNFIVVDRDNLLETCFNEVSSISNLRNPLEVKFTDEDANDYGGPRKEFFRLMLIAIKERYFDGGMRPDVVDDYLKCGVIMGSSVLQNGSIPQFLSEEILQELVNSQGPSPCVLKLREGMKKVGIYQVMSALPLFLHLFRNTGTNTMTVKKLVSLLKPKFSEEGSNARKSQKEVFNAFVRYIREVDAGKRENGSFQITLGMILQFCCGADEEPLLGFVKSPEICFQEYYHSFLPTANTCINVLNLPYASVTTVLPCDEQLFKLYDYSFASEYFGLI